MNRNVNKDGLGWTRQNWEKPKLRPLGPLEWSLTYRQRVYFAATRLFWIFGSSFAVFAVGWKFLPISSTSVRQGRKRMFGAEQDLLPSSDSLTRRYQQLPSVKSEVEHMADKFSPVPPGTITSVRVRLDQFIRDTADRVLGAERINPEKELYSVVVKESGGQSGEDSGNG